MKELAELLSKLEAIADLSEEDLAGIEEKLDGIVTELTESDTTADTVAALQQIADATDTIRVEREARAEAAAQLQAEAEAALNRIRGIDPEEEARLAAEAEEAEKAAAEAAEAAEKAEDAVEEAEAAVEDAEEADAAAEAVAASARRNAKAAPLASIKARQPKATKTVPAQAKDPSRVRLTAAPDLREYAAGSDFPGGWNDVYAAMCDVLEHSSGSGSGTLRRIGKLDWRNEYPEDRTFIYGQDGDYNVKLARDVTDGPLNPSDSLTAAGGLCAPLEVRYDVVDIASSERPLRDGLPSFRADRGGLTWMPSPVLTDVIVDNTNGAIDTTTVSGDAAAGTKTIQEFTCPSSVSKQVQAISERIQFGHFADRYWPENMRVIVNETRARFARHAEQLLFEDMRSQSTLVNSQMTLNPVGALPNFLGVMRRAARGYREQFRVAEGTTLRAVIPRWLVDVLATDLMYQAPGDDALTQVLAAQQLITRHLADMNVTPIWQRDDARTNDANGAGLFAWSSLQAAGALADYPGRASVLLFHEGAFLFLDGGTLDFGVIRDSATLAANKWQTFYESFEAAAMVGKASWNLTLQLCASGTRAALATVDCGPIGS